MKLHLSGHSIQSLRYLGDSADIHTRTNVEDKMLFDSWKVGNRTDSDTYKWSVSSCSVYPVDQSDIYTVSISPNPE